MSSKMFCCVRALFWVLRRVCSSFAVDKSLESRAKESARMRMHEHYCEPFGGSAAVLLNSDPSPIETYNDIDGEVVNFFYVLRDQTDALIKAIALTPFSREEFEIAISEPTEGLSNLERARRLGYRLLEESCSSVEDEEKHRDCCEDYRGGS